ncbi:MAG: biotin carboxylase, partial [Bacteroidetes bacterium]
PMIAKLITHGRTREEAIQRMIRAIDDYKITGIETTLGFCKFVMKHEAFTSGNFDTHFVQKHFKPEFLISHNSEEEEIASVLAAKLFEEKSIETKLTSKTASQSNWKIKRL